MKKLSILIPILAAIALFAQPVFAESTPVTQGSAAVQDNKMTDYESMMQASINKMHAQMATINQTKDPKKRLKLLQEHSKSMRDTIKMMREMTDGNAMKCAMGSGHMMSDHSSHDHAMPASAAQATPEQMSPAGKTSTSQTGKQWVCPMHPEVVRDHPDVCPICGMDLVEVDPSGATQSGHDHAMGACKMGGMKDGCKMGGMKDGCKMGGMKDGCKMGGMKDGCKMGGMKDGCKMGGMKDGCKMGGMKDGCKMGGMMGQMMGMSEQHMDMMLILMEQMIEHNDAAMSVRK